MVSEKDRAHFQCIAEAEAELNEEAVRAAARRPPGHNIALGFALSEFAAVGEPLSFQRFVKFPRRLVRNTGYPPSFAFKSSLTRAGLAVPLVVFIT